MQTFVTDGVGVDPAIGNWREIHTFTRVFIKHAGGVADQTEVGLGKDQAVGDVKSHRQTLSGAQIIFELTAHALSGLVINETTRGLFVAWHSDAFGGVWVVDHLLFALRALVLFEPGDNTVLDGDSLAGAVVLAIVTFGSVTYGAFGVGAAVEASLGTGLCEVGDEE